MYKEIHTVEDVLPFSVIVYVLEQAISVKDIDEKDSAEIYHWAKKINSVLENDFNSAPKDKIPKIKRRIRRATNLVIDYFLDQNFCINKSLLVLVGWLGALIDADAYILTNEKKEVLEEIISKLNKGYEMFGDGYAKRIASADKHVIKLHGLMQHNGYFV